MLGSRKLKCSCLRSESLFLCLFVFCLFICFFFVYLFSVCLFVFSLFICFLFVYLFFLCLFVFSLFFLFVYLFLVTEYFPELSRQKHFLDRKHKGRRRNFCNRAPRGGRGDHDPDSSDDEGREPRWVEEAGGVSDAGINEEGSGDNDGESAENRAKRLKTDTTVGGGEEAGGFSDAGTNQEGSDENDGESAEN